MGIRQKKRGSDDEQGAKKKTTGKRGKSERPVEVDNELFTKGPFSGTQIINDELGPDIPMADSEDESKPKSPSSRRDARKQERLSCAPVVVVGR